MPQQRDDLHIDGCEGTVGDGTADSASQGESGVESDTAELLGSAGSDLLDDGIDLCRAGGGKRCHLDYVCVRVRGEVY
jgi:hypothetical protein